MAMKKNSIVIIMLLVLALCCNIFLVSCQGGKDVSDQPGKSQKTEQSGKSGQSGQVSKITSKGIAIFANKELETIVRERIGKPEGDIHVNDLKEITEIYLDFSNGNKGISYFNGEQNSENVNGKKIRRDDFVDLALFQDLNHLSVVCLPVETYTVEAIGELKNLISLTLDECDVKDISALGSLKNLTELNLNRNYGLKDISPLSGLKNLTRLSLGIDLSDERCIKILAGMTDLTELELHHNDPYGVHDIEGLSVLTNLTGLDLTNCNFGELDGLKALKDLPNLKKLALKLNRIYDVSA
ncbi:MAG: leucine-rich repeat domain-containing protein, partial [Acetivibrionales bacterium]